MLRYAVQLFGVTLFALGLIWYAGPGDASQTSDRPEPALWADTMHINLNESKTPTEAEPTQDRDTMFKNIRKLNNAAFYIRNNYMEDVDLEKMVQAGISGMLTDLDRFSVLMEKSSYDALMESTHGKYSGLGMQIDSRDNQIVIITPMEGTPAYRKGLRAGDIITKINDKTTEGMKSADASGMMRGEAGTSVKLTIKRSGIPEPIDFDVERAVIELKSVNYSGVIPGTTVGYIRLSRFAEETSHELRDAISSLNEKNVTSLVLDLRSNGGGLLDQAKETAELFLQEGREIVYTRGKDETSERHYRSERPPLFPDKPMVVLVDEGTASASEIVAGAVQDWDRGLIVGNTTYGKGLVQQIFPISNDGSVALKLTTGKYYVPSGRCIQRSDRQKKPGSTATQASAPEEEELEPGSDTLKTADREVFYTNGGRVVFGGGGIVPDIGVDRETWKTIEINLERKSMFFDFAIKYVSGHPDVKPNFDVTPDVVNEFKAFLKEKDFTYKSAMEIALEDMRKTIGAEKKDSLFEPALHSLATLIDDEKVADFNKSEDYIKRAIKREIVSSIAGERGVYENIILTQDKAVKEALRIISTPSEYSRLMKEGQKKADS
ncbi:MAG: S41 family peptidase [candidate division Zixibacteria bacterium]|nr:S41 family peptidase [candidate division Zixibacteria bacterium]